MPPRRIDPLSLRFDLQDAVAKLMEEYGIRTQAQLADLAGIPREATVSDFFNRKVDTRPETIDRILGALQTTRPVMDELVRRMNGEAPVAPRSPDTRREDKDPLLRDAKALGEQIARLPRDARNALMLMARVLDDAFSDTKSRR